MAGLVKVSDMGVVGRLGTLTEVRSGLLRGKLKRVPAWRACGMQSTSISHDGNVSKIFFPDQRVSGHNE